MKKWLALGAAAAVLGAVGVALSNQPSKALPSTGQAAPTQPQVPATAAPTAPAATPTAAAPSSTGPATDAAASALAAIQQWQRDANQQVYAALNRPELVGKLMLQNWHCNGGQCTMDLIAQDPSASLPSLVSQLMGIMNGDADSGQPTHLSLAELGMENGHRKATLSYDREGTPPPRYTAKQMTQAMDSAAKFAQQNK